MDTPAPSAPSAPITTRELVQHRDGGTNDSIAVMAYPSAIGGATDQYSWSVKGQIGSIHPLQFAAPGVAGLSHEVLLAILIDRLGATPSCKHHAKALGHIEDALVWLQAHAHANRQGDKK